MPKYHVEYTDKKGEHHDIVVEDDDQEKAEEQVLYELEDEIDQLTDVREV